MKTLGAGAMPSYFDSIVEISTEEDFNKLCHKVELVFEIDPRLFIFDIRQYKGKPSLYFIPYKDIKEIKDLILKMWDYETTV